MLTVKNIATILEKTIRQVHKYIEQKHLKAKKIDGKYLIEEKDFDFFMENYYIRRHQQKGVKSIPNDKDMEYLYGFINDCMDNGIDYHEFSKKYKHISKTLPPLDKFVLAIRNKHIIKDLKTMRQSDVADKYNLALITIKTISSKSKQRRD